MNEIRVVPWGLGAMEGGMKKRLADLPCPRKRRG